MKAPGVIAACVVVAAGVVLAGCAGAATQYAQWRTGRSSGSALDTDPGADRVRWTQVSTGDCISFPDGLVVDEIYRHDCANVHAAEVYDVVSTDEPWPGDGLAEGRVYAACRAGFDEAVGIPYTDTSLDVTYVYGDGSSWDHSPVQFMCAAIDPRESLSGPLADVAETTRIRDADGRLTKPMDVTWDKLVAGDCAETITQETYEAAVPCDEPHQVEVIAATMLPEDTVIESLATDVEQFCDDSLEAYTAGNATADLADLQLISYYPDETTWGQGDRYVQCRLESDIGPVAGSVASPEPGVST